MIKRQFLKGILHKEPKGEERERERETKENVPILLCPRYFL
jgi:hypothetical protein